MAVLLVADRGLEADRLLGNLQHLANLVDRHRQLFGEFLRSRLAADFVKHLARGAHQLVDRLDHVHRNTDGARLIGDRAGDGLPDPPGGIGREFIAAAVLELVDGLHQADVAFLDQVQELQAPIGVFLRNGDHQAQVRLDHFLLRAGAFALAALDGLDDGAEFRNRQPDIIDDETDLVLNFGKFVTMLRLQLAPLVAAVVVARPALDTFAVRPGFEKLRARHAGGRRRGQQAALDLGDMLVQGEELVRQRLDPVGMEIHAFHQLDELDLEIEVIGLGTRRQRLVIGHFRKAPVLRAAELLEQRRDLVEHIHHMVADGIFHRRKRHVQIITLVAGIGIAGRGIRISVAILLGFFFRLFFLGFFLGEVVLVYIVVHARHHFPVHRRAVQLGVSGLEINDVTERHHTVGNLVAPVQQRPDGQRGFANAADHQLSTGLDTFGNRDLSLARKQLDAAHLAKIHAHRIVGAGYIAVGHIARRALFLALAFRGVVAVRCFDNGYAHLVQRRHEIVNLLGGEILGWKRSVQLVMGDVAALLSETHQRLQGLLRGVIVLCLCRAVLRLHFCFGLLICLGCHECYLLPLGRGLSRPGYLGSICRRR